MAPKLTELEQTLKSNRETLKDSHAAIQNQITDNDLKKGEIAFFDEKGNRLRSRKEGNNVIFSDDNGNEFASEQQGGKGKLIIPTGTNRIVANCDIDITGLNPAAVSDKLDESKQLDKLKQPKIFYIYVDGNVTGKNVSIPHSEIHATGNVDLKSISKFDEKHEIKMDSKHATFVCGGNAKLNDFKYATVVNGGSKKISYNGSKASKILKDSDAMVDGTHIDKIVRSRNSTRMAARPSLTL